MTVSHELRTPLTAIYGWARVLGTREMPKPDAAARARGDRAQRARADAPDRRPARRVARDQRQAAARDAALNVADVAARGGRNRRPGADRQGIRFDDDARRRHAADPGRSGSLQQVVWNLLSNAIKFTPEGGTVRLRLRRAGRARRRSTSATAATGIDRRVPAARLRAVPPGRHRLAPPLRRPRPRAWRSSATWSSCTAAPSVGRKRRSRPGFDIPRAAAGPGSGLRTRQSGVRSRNSPSPGSGLDPPCPEARSTRPTET